MANTLTALIPDLYEALDVVSREMVGFIPSVTINAELEADESVSYLRKARMEQARAAVHDEIDAALEADGEPPTSATIPVPSR